MTEHTCVNCKHWDYCGWLSGEDRRGESHFESGSYGRCRMQLIEINGVNAPVKTNADFGCNQWQGKESGK